MQNFLTFLTFPLYILHFFICIKHIILCVYLNVFLYRTIGFPQSKKICSHVKPVFPLSPVNIIRAPRTLLPFFLLFLGDFPVVKLNFFFFILTGFWLKRPKKSVFLLLCCRAQLLHFARAYSVIKASRLDFTGKLL